MLKKLTPVLPSGYTELEYIQKSGAGNLAYIDTGFYQQAGHTISYKLKYKITSSYSSFSLFGGEMWSFGTKEGGLYHIGWNAGRDTLCGGNAIREYGTITVNVLRRVTYTGVATQTNSHSDLFGTTRRSDNKEPFENPTPTVLLYNFQIYDNGVLVRDFIPVKNSSNAIGMFDTVSNTFFANKGRGSFTAGPEVTTPTKSLKEIHELYKKNSGGTLDYIGELYKSDGQGGVEHIFSAGYDKTLSGTAPLTLPNARAKETSWKIEGQSSQNGTPSPSSPLDVKGVGDLNGSNYVIPITISDGTATTTHNLNLSAPLQKIGTYKDSVESDGTLTVKVGKTILSAGTHTISDAMTNSPYLCTQQVSGTLSGQSITLDTGVTNADVYYVKATETETTVSVPSISTIKGTNYVDVTTEIQPSDVSVTYRSKYQ